MAGASIIHLAQGPPSLFGVFPLRASPWTSALQCVGRSKETWEDGPSNSKNEIQDVMDLPKTLWYISGMLSKSTIRTIEKDWRNGRERERLAGISLEAWGSCSNDERTVYCDLFVISFSVWDVL